MQCWKGREKELKSFLFYIVGIAPLHLWIFLIYFPGLCDCENLQGAKVQCWKACITIFLFQIVWIAGSISEFSQSVWGFGSVWLWVPKIRAQNQYDFCGHARVHPEQEKFGYVQTHGHLPRSQLQRCKFFFLQHEHGHQHRLFAEQSTGDNAGPLNP